MQFDIEIISVGGPTNERKGTRQWQSLELAYKKDGKVEGRKLMDFSNKVVFADLQNFKQGDTVRVTAEKGPDDKYWTWTAVTPLSGGDNPEETAYLRTPAARAPAAPAAASTGRVIGNTYETPEERKLRRDFEVEKSRVITNLAVLNSALTFFELSKGKPSSEEVLAQAEEFRKWATAAPAPTFDNLSDDIPF